METSQMVTKFLWHGATMKQTSTLSALIISILLAWAIDSPQAQQTFSVCIGEGPIWGDGSGCPLKLDGYFPCDFAYQHPGDTDSAAAEQFCKAKGGTSAGFKRLRSYGGHKC